MCNEFKKVGFISIVYSCKVDSDNRDSKMRDNQEKPPVYIIDFALFKSQVSILDLRFDAEIIHASLNSTIVRLVIISNLYINLNVGSYVA